MNKVIGIGVILQTKDGTYLLQKRDQNTDRHPGRIAPFGGGLEENENVLECAKRELQEELSLNLTEEDLVTVGIFESRHVPEAYIQMFIAKEVEKESLKLQEGEDIIELSLQEALDSGKVTDFAKEVLRSL